MTKTERVAPRSMDGLAAQTPPPADTVVFGHYRVRRLPGGELDELGRGAMGVTYRGFDPGLRKAVAIKVIAAAYVHDEDTRRRFQREARAAAQLTHPHVAGVLHLGEQDGQFFYAMEFVAGRPLADLLKTEKILPPTVALALLGQVAAALAAAHKRELIHRDLKPANLMLLEGEGLDHEDERIRAAGGRQIKVVDFGLARSFGGSRAEDSLATQSTLAAAFTGTPAYASPEQCAGVRDLDGRSDLYSLGIILWQCLTGHLPFVGTPVQVLGMQQFQPPPFAQLAGLPEPLIRLLEGLLEKDPTRRTPATAGELREAFDRIRGALGATAGKLAETEPPSRVQVQPSAAPATAAASAKPLSATAASLGVAPTVRTGSAETFAANSSLAAGATRRESLALRAPTGEPPAPPPTSPTARMAWVLVIGALAVGAAWLVRDRMLPAPSPKISVVSATPTPGAKPTTRPQIAPTVVAETPAAALRRLAGRAREEAGRISAANARTEALGSLAVGCALAGSAEAVEVFRQAVESAKRISAASERSDMLLLLAVLQRQGGTERDRLDTLLAARAAAQEQTGAGRDIQVQQVAEALMRNGFASDARGTLLLIPAGFYREIAVGAVAAELVKRGDVAGGLQMVRDLSSDLGRSIALPRVAVAQAEAGEVAGARRTLEGIPTKARLPSHGDDVSLAEAMALAKAGDTAGAARVVGQIKTAYFRAQGTARLALALARAGDRAGAGTAFGAAYNWARELKEESQISVLVDLAERQTEAGDREGAIVTLLGAKNYGSTLPDAQRRNAALARVAEAQAAQGAIRAAELTLGEMVDPEGGFRAPALLGIVLARARAKEFEAARQAVQALPTQRTLRGRGCFVVANVQAWEPGGPAAIEAWVGQLPSPEERAQALSGLLHALARRQQGQKEFRATDVTYGE